jgi:hypothetical protein
MPTKVGASFSLDQASLLRLRIFGFKLAIIVPVSVALALHHNYPLLATISFLCFWHSVFAGIAASVQSHRQNAAFLTAWDEMAAFLGLAVLMRIVDRVIG